MPGKMFQPGKLYTYNGKTLSPNAWANETGFSTQTMWKRFRKYDKGEMTIEQVFAPTKQSIIKNTEGLPYKQICTDAWYENFARYVIPSLPKEFQKYMRTGEKGNGMQLAIECKLHNMAGYEKHEARSSQPQGAQVAIIFSDKQRPEITVVAPNPQ